MKITVSIELDEGLASDLTISELASDVREIVRDGFADRGVDVEPIVSVQS